MKKDKYNVQKIIIKNFGPIKDAEIEIKKTLILIGEQASGKSTIAKLIYFFRSLGMEIGDHIRNFAFDDFDNYKNEFNIDEARDLINPIKAMFYNFFGTTVYQQNFNIQYFFDSELNRYLEISLIDEKSLLISFSSNFFTKDWKYKINESINDFKNHTRNSIKYKGSESLFEENANLTGRSYTKFWNILDDIFLSNSEYESLFVIAGRNSTVSYSNLFEKYLFADLQNKVTKNSKIDFKFKDQTVDEILMLKFIERIEQIKMTFELNGGSFKGLMNVYSEKYENKNTANPVLKRINQILKGCYNYDGSNEKITLNGTEHKFVTLKNASSGQQESIRILQDIFLNILEENIVFRVIEEPEAHLFPEAQKLLVELFAILVNVQKENQLILTTHSPYILTAYNNLLFANRVVQKNEALKAEVLDIVDEHCLLDSQDFAAYGLKIVQNEDDVYCRSIVDAETGLIDQNFLDSVSDTLNAEFQALYSLHTKTFARK